MSHEGSIVIPTAAFRRALVALLALLVVGLIVFLVAQFRDKLPGLAGGVDAEIDRNAYQAVFLDTGQQVYFGHLTQRGGYFLLNDVFYLTTSNPADGAPRGQLVKRGDELHGPKDPMLIPASQVLFIENMKDDSDVVQAIKRFKSGAPQLSPPPPGLTATPIPPAQPSGSARPSPTR